MQRRKLNQENKDNKKKLFILLGVVTLSVIVGSVIAINNGKNKRVEETQKEVSLQTIDETETKEKEEFSKLELEAKLENYDINKSSKIIAKITDTKEKEDTFSVMDIKKGKEKDQFILSKDLVMNKEYVISLIPSINKDGSINEIKNDFKINTSFKNFTEKVNSKFIKKEDVTKAQLEDIIKKTTVAVQNGDDTLINENGKKVLDLVNTNVKNTEIAKKDDIKVIDVKAVQETRKETNKKDSKPIEKETQKEKSVVNKPQTPKQNTKTEKPKENKVTKPSPSKPSETKPTQPSKPKETKKEVVRTTETQSISFDTIDNYAYTGGRSRVYQEGRSGERTIVKEDGKVVSNTVTRQAQDKIIERYVKVQNAEYKTVEKKVNDLDKPIYRERGRARWFVKNDFTGETKYFYSAEEAHAEYSRNGDKGQLSSWGTAETEVVVTDKIIGYKTKIVKEKVKVSDEVWEWKH